MAIKIKKYGKNVRALKKLLSIESTKVTLNGIDHKKIFQGLIGYDYIIKPRENGFEAYACGDTFIIETTQILEFI